MNHSNCSNHADEQGFVVKRFFLSILVTISIIYFDSLVHTVVASDSTETGQDYELVLDERLDQLPFENSGPFVRLGDGEVMTVDSHHALISTDEGNSWEAYPIFMNIEKYEIRPERVIHRTDDGVVILAFMNQQEYHWTWSDELGDAPGARLPTYVVRSLDDGRTWEEPVMLHKEWTGAIKDIIETSNGNIVFTSMMLLHNPGRHSVLTYMSEDQGESWHRSNIIDMGGAGHHGGVTEATLEELKDGRLMKLIRTNWMQLWRAESNDNGLTWHSMGPSGITASSTPAMLTRLKSGRLMLLWNQPYPEGENSYPKRGGDRIWSAVPVSNFRGELSLAFSEDDGDSWSEPVIIARIDSGENSYPFAFEASPGEIWVTTWRGPLRAKFYEEDFLPLTYSNVK